MSLDDFRKKIDELDHKLVKLLNERARVVVDIGKLKTRTDKPVYAPDREKEVFERITQANEGPLPDKCLMAIWRELMSGSFVLERPLRIGYLGPGGSFSHTAAMLKFGQSVEYEPLTDIVSIFDEVSKGHCDLGLAPVENTMGGGVIETLDALVDSNVKVCAEVLMAIHHSLLGNCPLEEIENPQIQARGRKAHKPDSEDPQPMKEWLLADRLVYGLVNVRTDGDRVALGVMKEDGQGFQVETFHT